MKTIPSIIAATVLLASVSATAGNYEQTDHDTLVTSAAPTKAAAYQLGVSKLAQLESISPSRLSNALGVIGADDSTVHLNEGSYVETEERMSADGKLSYVGLINVNFGYTVNDSDN